MTRIIVLGAGGHGRVVVNTLQTAGHDVSGIVDQDASLVGERILGVEVLGVDGLLDTEDPEATALANGIGSVAETAARREIFEHFRNKLFRFVDVIHPSVVIAEDVVRGEGAQIMAGAVVQSGCSLSENSLVNTSASIDHDCSIGAHSHIAPGAVLSGSVIVGAGCHVGCGATIVQGVRIGENAIVGAGAVVLDEVAPGTTVFGIPARPVTKVDA